MRLPLFDKDLGVCEEDQLTAYKSLHVSLLRMYDLQ